MKILFVGDYSNYHVTLAKTLRGMGHDCTIVSAGSRCMDTERDIDLQRKPGIIGGARYVRDLHKLLPLLSGFDVVQLINPNFLHLRPWLIYRFFKQLKKRNGKIGLSVCGSDPIIVDALCKGEMLRYSEYRIRHSRTPYAIAHPEDEQQWLTPTMREHCLKIYAEVDFAVSSLFEYQTISQPVMNGKLHYLGIPVDTDSLPYHPAGQNDKLNIFIGIKSEIESYKGTDRLLAAAKRLANEYPQLCTVTEARDLPYTEYINKLKDADIVLDQIYSYTPATNALEAMAMGKVAVSGAEPEYYSFIAEKELHPIVNVLPDDNSIYTNLKELVLNRDIVRRLANQGPKFVKRHNDASLLANRYLEVIS